MMDRWTTIIVCPLDDITRFLMVKSSERKVTVTQYHRFLLSNLSIDNLSYLYGNLPSQLHPLAKDIYMLKHENTSLYPL